jgi:Uma2 family endonuclease
MSAEAVGAQIPTRITLDDLVVMAAVDGNHRYELSGEAVLTVAPPADPDHALLVSRMFTWLLSHGHGLEQGVTDRGIDVGGERVPDLTVWDRGRPAWSGYPATAGLRLVVEVVARGCEVVDRIIKKAEYARAGIPVLVRGARRCRYRAPVRARP